jgi:hypothetical protein
VGKEEVTFPSPQHKEKSLLNTLYSSLAERKIAVRFEYIYIRFEHYIYG